MGGASNGHEGEKAQNRRGQAANAPEGQADREHRRALHPQRGALGAHRAAPGPASKHPPLWRRTAPRAGSTLRGRYLLCLENRLPMERALRHRAWRACPLACARPGPIATTSSSLLKPFGASPSSAPHLRAAARNAFAWTRAMIMRKRASWRRPLASSRISARVAGNLRPKRKSPD
jgi:hypothetical protein